MENTVGTYKDNILKLESGNSVVSDKGKEAILNYKVLDYNFKENISLVEIDLKSGRHHQIRVQFAHHLHPLCGDQRYGKSFDNTQIALCAYKLSFVHPTTKQVLNFELKPLSIGFWKYFKI